MSASRPISDIDADIGPSIDAHIPAAANAGVIYIIVAPEKSSYNATFRLARGLKALGYRVTYLIPPQDKDYIAAQDLDYRSFDIAPPELPAPTYRGPLRRQVHAWQQTRAQIKQGEQIVAQVYRQAETYLAADDPILILMNPLLMWSSLPAIRSGHPIITLNTTLASTMDSRYPPAFTALTPADGPASMRERVRYGWAWLRLITPIWFQQSIQEKVTQLVHALPPSRSPTAVARRHGHGVRWGEYGPCLDVPEFVLSAAEIDFPAHRTARPRTYVGACVDVQRDDGQWDWGTLNPADPLVYCSLGTYSASYAHSRSFFMAVCEALRHREDLQAIIQIGNAMDIEELGDLPERIRVVRHAPQVTILRHANVFITHGGFSSVREAAYFGVPMIVFPCWLDQPGNAARVVYHGLGVSGDIATITPEKVLEMLSTLDSGQYCERSMTMQAAFRQQEDCQKGIDFILRYLGVSSSPPTACSTATQI